ncbi:alginate lyase family protein [Paenibacillus qinlingensis]|uniref:alginate lyase family protein n=1 Tax=Paenibacillus qinlingensis TaxID=1837343 RepID=UPI0015657D98|nr:alginate lyase family protein [Paenibacillus qinlingensis]NQX63104.1 alginate lyase family protein [Paenibacillus qinlingensis]
MIEMGYKNLRHNPNFTQLQMTDETFIRQELDLERPDMVMVREHMALGDVIGARDAYLALIDASVTKRYYFNVSDVPSLMAYARERYGDDEDAKLSIAEANRIVTGDLPLIKGKRVQFQDGKYDWNSWLYDSSQYQLHLTRFVYVKHLARAYCVTGDEKYAACWNEMMHHFIDDNPVPVNDTFRAQHCTWDPLSVGVRLFMLPEAFMTFWGSASFTPEVKMKVIKSFHEHGRYVRSYHAHHGNHATMQLRGLIQVALLLPELKVSSTWLSYGLKELPSYIQQNVYEDGVQFEASPNYHLVVMRDLFELVPLFQTLGLTVESSYEEVLEQMYIVLLHMLTPDGQLPRFGDTDAHVPNELRTTMSLGAYLYHRADFKYCGHAKLPFSLLWRLGPQAVERYERLTAEKPKETLASFPVGGYILSRHDWKHDALYMGMRAGVGINGHAHSDALSVIMYAGGKELLPDSGMGLFEWNKERKYTVSTRAHNTVVVDGQDQHVRGLHWNAPPTAACKIWDVRSKAQYDYWFASHYGYTRYDDPVIHSRKVLFVKNRYWLIVDLFEANELHRYEQYYHLPCGEVICDWEARKVSTHLEGANVQLLYPPQAGQEDVLTVESGLLFHQGEYYTNPVVKRSLSVLGKATMETVIVPNVDGGTRPHVLVHRASAHQQGRELAPWEATALRIEGEGWSDDICLYHGNVDVQSYLDHTGNIVSASLLPKPRAIEGLSFAGDLHREDVIIKSR